ncbi:MAG TPA: hypothetical protein VK836_13480 [Streptosporangiaceae bacterium]|nr:hypothetical protein [Streptosporangiaceae bacterium]
MTQLISVTDGRVSIRSEDRAGAGPLAAIVSGDIIAGWVSYDGEWDRLAPGEVLVRYDMRARSFGHDRAFRALQLLLHHLATRSDYRTAVLRVPPGDAGALALATAAGFTCGPGAGGDGVLRRPVPPVRYTDGVVTIRRQRPDDIDRHLEAIDNVQIDWLWEPGDRRKWEAQTPDQQRARNQAHLHAFHESLAYRRRGNFIRAVHLITQFLHDHTGAESAHIIVDARNAASLRVASAVRVMETERWRDRHGRTMIRHVLALR